MLRNVDLACSPACKRLSVSADGSGGDEAKATSQDVSALARAGPCKDYASLQSLQSLRTLGLRFRACTSNKAIKEVNEVCQSEKNC